MQNVAQRLTYVTGIGVSSRDYVRWTSGFNGTDTERAVKILLKDYKPSLSELMYVLLLLPSLPKPAAPAVEQARQRVKTKFDVAKETD